MRISGSFTVAGVTYVLLTIGALVMVVPFFWMLSTSLKLPAQVFVLPPQWIPNPVTLSNYTEIFRRDYITVRAFANSVIFVVTVTIGLTIMGALSGFAFARLRVPGQSVLLLAYVASLIVPGHITIIPVFLVVNRLGWIDTYPGLIAPILGTASVGIFLYRQFFKTLPAELYEAARMDGAGPSAVLWHVYLPLSGPVTAAFGTLTALTAWNMFLWPLIVTNSDGMRVLPLALARLGAGGGAVGASQMMAATTLTVAPMLVLYAIGQRWFVQGIARTGIKG
jgi:multiple sugar transport system permease protein